MHNLAHFVPLLTAAACLLIAPPARAIPKTPPQRVILDTDIGDDIDDAYALALLASRPDVQLLGVTTAFGQTPERAQIAAKLLSLMGRGDVPICAGRRGPSEIRRQYDWARGYGNGAMKKEVAVAFLKRQIVLHPGEVTIVAIGPLTNIGDLLTKYPEVKTKIARIVIMGGSVYQGYGANTPPAPEWNIKCDPAAAKVVFESGVPLVMAGLEVTTGMRLDAERQKRLLANGTPTTDALAALTNLWGGGEPVLFDVVAVCYALGHSLCDAEERRVEVEDDGMTRIVEGSPNAKVLVHPHEQALMDWYIEAMHAR